MTFFADLYSMANDPAERYAVSVFPMPSLREMTGLHLISNQGEVVAIQTQTVASCYLHDATWTHYGTARLVVLRT